LSSNIRAAKSFTWNNGVFMTVLENYLSSIKNYIDNIDPQDFNKALDILKSAYNCSQMILIFGNGGSAATSSHLAEDLSKGCACEGKAVLRAVSLTDNTPLLTAISNDLSYEMIFEKQLEILYTEGSVIIAISASGNSANVLRGVTYARKKGAKIISFTGFEGGQLKKISDANIHVPLNDFGPIEDMHMMIGHILTVYMRDYIRNL
jgi:D-sedoheptulose 7-phosphate isomerase